MTFKPFFIGVCLLAWASPFGAALAASEGGYEILESAQRFEKTVISFACQMGNKDVRQSLYQKNEPNGDFGCRISQVVKRNGFEIPSEILINKSGYWELAGKYAVRIEQVEPKPFLIAGKLRLDRSDRFEVAEVKIGGDDCFAVTVIPGPAGEGAGKTTYFVQKRRPLIVGYRKLNAKGEVAMEEFFREPKLNSEIDPNLFRIPAELIVTNVATIAEAAKIKARELKSDEAFNSKVRQAKNKKKVKAEAAVQAIMGAGGAVFFLGFGALGIVVAKARVSIGSRELGNQGADV